MKGSIKKRIEEDHSRKSTSEPEHPRHMNLLAKLAEQLQSQFRTHCSGNESFNDMS